MSSGAEKSPRQDFQLASFHHRAEKRCWGLPILPACLKKETIIWYDSASIRLTISPLSGCLTRFFFNPHSWNCVPNRSARLRSLPQQCSPLTEVMFTYNICLNYETPTVKTIDIFNCCIPEQMREIFQSSYQELNRYNFASDMVIHSSFPRMAV